MLEKSEFIFDNTELSFNEVAILLNALSDFSCSETSFLYSASFLDLNSLNTTSGIYNLIT